MPSSEGEIDGTEMCSSGREMNLSVKDITSLPIDKEQDQQTPATSISSKGRVRQASRRLMESTNPNLKSILSLLATAAAYTLHAPHFAYAEYKRINFQKRVSFHAKTLHHLEVINMNADSTYNYTSK